MLKYKHIEACREARLWIGQVIVPAVITGTFLYRSNDNVRLFVDDKVDKIKKKKLFKK